MVSIVSIISIITMVAKVTNCIPQAVWSLEGEIRWPSMYHGFSVSMWIKLVPLAKGYKLKLISKNTITF